MSAAQSISTDAFRPDINGLRAIAVAAVVLFHFDVSGFTGGFLGVDVFFVISGFLMTRIIVGKLEAGRFSTVEFYLARARRIFPALAVVCAVLLAAAWFSLDPTGYKALALHAASSLAFVSNIVFWQEAGYFASASHEKWLLHTWSLSAEWQFYLLLPLALGLTWRLFGTRRSIVVMVVVACAASLALSVVATPLRDDAAYYLLPTRAWEMMAGGIVYLASPHVPLSRISRVALEAIGLVLIVAGAILYSPATPWPGHAALVPVVGTALVILAANTDSVITNNRIAGFLGDTSYSVYLWHWPVAAILNSRQLGGQWTWTVIGIAAALLLGYLSYRFVEMPTRKLESLAIPRVATAAFATVAAALISLGAVIHFKDGFPSRLGTGEKAYLLAAAAVDDWDYPGKGCRTGLYATQCNSPGTGAGLAMFIGDSHIEQFYARYGQSRHNRETSTAFVTQGGCPPIRGLAGKASGNCARYADVAWAEVRARKPDKLIIGSFWWRHFFDFSGNMGGGMCIESSSGCAVVRDRAMLRKAFETFEQDVRSAVESGVSVYILGPIPMSGMDYPKLKMAELSAAALPLPVKRSAGPIDAAGGFQFSSKVDSPPSILLGELREIARRTNATLVAPDEYMCPEHVCALVDSAGAPIYKDSNHLRLQYVKSDALLWLDRQIGVRD